VAKELVPLIRVYSPTTKVIFDTVDIASVRLRREYEVIGDPEFKAEADKARRSEANLASDADEVWCVTEVDAAYIRALSGVKRVRVVPTIHMPRLSTPGFADRSGLLFVGSGVHRPNADAVRYFGSEFLPIVKASLPSVDFSVAGSYRPAEMNDIGPDTHLLGYVQDLAHVFDTARVFVCPLRYGSGMKGKIGEALAAGVPVVTTSIGAEGMRLIDAENALIRDDPGEFAAAVVRLYNDRELWEKLRVNGISHVGANFSPQAVDLTIADALNGLGVL
jgi:glycosyltransferase involved in cell wall biosynthesis